MLNEWRKWRRLALNLVGAACSVATCAYTGNWAWAITAAAFGFGAGTSLGIVWLKDVVQAAECAADEREREAIKGTGVRRG